MERKTARISKEPEVKRQEILGIAVKIFMGKGYEAAIMRDIAAAMNVVPGLCYRCFEPKQVLCSTMVEQYVKEVTLPVTRALGGDQDKTEGSLEQFLDDLEQPFLGMDGKERYHHFFHEKENRHLQMLLSIRLCEAICLYLESRLGRMKDKGMVKVENLSLTASYLLFGAAPVVENGGFSSWEKVACIGRVCARILNP